ncbi:RNA polymerase sigma factor [Pelagerythrobacter aerophilus]|uniref:RNA polymerase sigma factor n=1 Tax=Pelagerythrobacter aerophilus TaxID=2306995 RepID=A0A418NMH4_9SPHN|nr:RNA polymerase sigma factor [Pelagerythrobacter aerophilus]RIV81704.1 RNA polymerase sigma factor [Pelagerythrobacter aerophilus]
MSADLSQCSDEELAVFARARREDAYRELLRRYKAGVYRLIVKQVGDAEEAMDLTQESFVAGFSALDRYDGDRPFRTWIARIALNKCRDWARRRKVRAFFSRALPLESAHHVASDGPAPDSEATAKRELARVRGAIDQLPQNLREVLLLRGVDEVSQAEAAAILRVSEKTVETRLYRARTRLKELLAGTSARARG